MDKEVFKRRLILQFMFCDRTAKMEMKKLSLFLQALIGESFDFEDVYDLAETARRYGHLEKVIKFAGYDAEDLIEEFNQQFLKH